jgi:hypothetical protein
MRTQEKGDEVWEAMVKETNPTRNERGQGGGIEGGGGKSLG